MERELKIGSHVIFIDSSFKEHESLVTHVWPNIGGGQLPGCNVVHVSGDEARKDNYGRQVERATSIVHLSMQPAKASCWRWPSE